jgi:DNA polymerase III alpha subunit (gram-positive type)
VHGRAPHNYALLLGFDVLFSFALVKTSLADGYGYGSRASCSLFFKNFKTYS